jgi:hypothetical protein
MADSVRMGGSGGTFIAGNPVKRAGLQCSAARRGVDNVTGRPSGCRLRVLRANKRTGKQAEHARLERAL